MRTGLSPFARGVVKGWLTEEAPCRDRAYVLTALVAVLALATACSSPPPEQQLVDDAAAALGGADRLRGLTSISVQGEGDAPNIGQNRLPDSELPNWKVTEYRRTTDLASDRTDMTQKRTAQFQFAGALVQRQHQAQDGDVAVNYPPRARRCGAPRPRRATAGARRCSIRWRRCGRRSPAVEPSEQPPPDGDNDVVDVRTSHGDVIQLAVSRATKLPVRVAMLDAHRQPGRRHRRDGVQRLRGGHRREDAEAPHDHASTSTRSSTCACRRTGWT